MSELLLREVEDGDARPEEREGRRLAPAAARETEHASAREFVYTVKATASGSFAVPPAYGEGMYDRGVRAWSPPGRIVVRRP